jgi:hypothetical protein
MDVGLTKVFTIFNDPEIPGLYKFGRLLNAKTGSSQKRRASPVVVM